MPTMCRVSMVAVLLVAAEGSYSFLTLGDWGGAALSSSHAESAHAVADQMGKTAAENAIKFVVNVGDNFYYCGIKNTSDFQIGVDYMSVYKAASLQVPWYSTLGNHEYGYNVEAQIQFSDVDPSKRWYMPARYYTKRVQLDAGHYLTIIVTDTNPCISQYRSSSEAGWDPCGSDFPTCDPVNEGVCKFHENIMTQDCSAQLAWFKTQLAQVPKDDWLIVVGHHPADEIDVEDFPSALQSHGFDLYLCGHVHSLEHFAVNGKAAYVVSGAASMVRTQDQDSDQRCQAANASAPSAIGSGSDFVFSQKVAGFTLHTFNDDFTSLKTDFVSYEGKVLHTFSVQKGSAPGPPSPSPTPPPAPGPPSPSPTPPPSGSCAGAGARWNDCQRGCSYVHASHAEACGVTKFGCYDCTALPSACPDCSTNAAASVVV